MFDGVHPGISVSRRATRDAEAPTTRPYRSLAEIEADAELSERDIQELLDFAAGLVEEKAEVGGHVVELFHEETP